MKKLVGQKVELEGKLSDLPWQHLINFSDTHKEIQYFDLVNGDQIVVYSQNPIECAKKMKLSGKVIEVIGKSKRPGDTSEIEYVEYQILVDDWECFN